MCIIAAKPAGVEMPSTRYILNMYRNNSDGAGLMYVKDRKVCIEKGFMDESRLLSRLAELDTKLDLKATPVVMHFRITTHGGTKPENCHPFPVTDSMGMLKKLKSKTNLGVAHNGIITIDCRSKDISDTMEYIAGQLAPLKRAVPKFYENKDLLQMVHNAIDSKMVLLDKNGKMVFIGDFQEENGIKYSNSSYKYERTYRNFSYGYSDYGLDIMGYASDYEMKNLMWLDDSAGDYVRARNGEMLQDDFAIDSDGNLYYFDMDYETFVRCHWGTAHSFDGATLKYNPDSEYVFTEVVMT